LWGPGRVRKLPHPNASINVNASSFQAQPISAIYPTTGRLFHGQNPGTFLELLSFIAHATFPAWFAAPAPPPQPPRAANHGHHLPFRRATASEVLAALPDPPSYSAGARSLRARGQGPRASRVAEGWPTSIRPTCPPPRRRAAPRDHLMRTFLRRLTRARRAAVLHGLGEGCRATSSTAIAAPHRAARKEGPFDVDRRALVKGSDRGAP
jgi:hypothetical protein